MQSSIAALSLAALILAGASTGRAQAQTPSGQRAEALRAQLRDVEARQAELQTRIQQLDVELQPENIQNSLATVGSTRPEELREQRRRQLEKEKAGVMAQLDQLATSHQRLESAMAAADAEAYRQSAGLGAAGAQPSQPPATAGIAQPAAASINGSAGTTATPLSRRRRRARRPRRRKTRSVARPAVGL